MFRKRRAFLLIFLVLASLSIWFLYCAYRQDSLDVAFITAVKNKDTDKALFLLRQGADINTRQPLDVSSSPRAYAHTLFDRLSGRRIATKTSWSALMLSVANDDTALTLTLLNRGAVGVNETAIWRGPSDEGAEVGPDPLLVIAASRGNVELVQALLAHGAHTEARGASGVTALLASSYKLESLLTDGWLVTSQRYQAATLRYKSLLRLLVDHGADPKARSSSGQSVLCRAAIYGQEEEVALLLARGADPWDKDPTHPTNLTALYTAISQNNVGIVKMLLARGVRVDARGDYSLVLTYDVTLVRLLLDHGADINAREKDGGTALDFAAENEDNSIVALLKSRGGRK